jgi:hypothetical protein
MKTTSRVDFFCVGAARSGTTWLADVFRDHPDVYVPLEKEVGYFNAFMAEDPAVPNRNYGKPLSWYHDFYRGAKKGQLLGDLTPTYMRYEGTAERIHTYNPSAKIIFMLREPVERSLSEFLLWQQRGVVNYKSFDEAIVKFPHLLDGSLYCDKVRPFLEMFGEQNVHFVLFDELKSNAQGVCEEVSRFFGVRAFIPESVFGKSNPTRAPRLRRLNALISGARLSLRRNEPLHVLLPILHVLGIVKVAESILSFNKSGKRPSYVVERAVREGLKVFFREDIESLEALIGRDLSHWK